jgi:hypothetical protein
MRRGLFFLGGMLALNAPSSAQAAPQAIQAAESSVRLGLTAGYGTYETDVLPQDSADGAFLGFTAGIGSLTPTAFARFGWPDLYVSVSDDFSAGWFQYRGGLPEPGDTTYTARDDSYQNTAIVRLGLGRPFAGSAEIIPFVAGGYQNGQRDVGGPMGYGEYAQAGLLGGGLKLDVAATPLLVLSAMAEGFAVTGGTVSAPFQNFPESFGSNAEERVSLDADYRISNAWHAFAGIGITHYDDMGARSGGAGVYEQPSATLQVNSMFGLAYGF